ncbi:unnamed protein product [Lymnaea stagnalis]|uniref:BHLH domain-containing protein n=1 Tax=Lymnaea stagnalis TaxID=6523 RepID=A0AAV2HR06_LYMST
MVTTMASVKLVNSHPPHHHVHYHPPHHHFSLLRPASPPEQTMTLDYSIPRRSRSPDYDGGSDSARDVSSPLSPAGSEGRDPSSLSETPTKKNKRKLSEPKKRSDISVKKLCPDKLVECKETVAVDAVKKNGKLPVKNNKGKKLANGHSRRATSSKPQTSGRVSRRDKSPSSPSAGHNDDDESKKDQATPLSRGLPQSFIHPVFAGLPPSALAALPPSAIAGYVPGIYFGGAPFHHPGLHTSFPALPLHLQHSYITAAAAAAAAAQNSSSSPSTSSSLAAASTSSASAPSISSTSGTSGIKSETFSSTCQRSQTIINAPVLQTSKPSTSLVSALTNLSSSSSLLQPSSSLHLAGSSKATTSNHEDDDDESSSRAQSPEDLSLGGRMSRKHRKNYKNMTRERRVEANARERTRVHTISAAFDALRHAVPSYSHNQKLSKLAILRIACSYIMSLARLADLDYTSVSEHIGTPLTFAECVDMCTSTIQTEGRARRRH